MPKRKLIGRMKRMPTGRMTKKKGTPSKGMIQALRKKAGVKGVARRVKPAVGIARLMGKQVGRMKPIKKVVGRMKRKPTVRRKPRPAKRVLRGRRKR